MKSLWRASFLGKALLLGSCAVALMLAAPAMAADGRIPIGTVPYTIPSPGDYYLSADLTYSGAGNAITFGASGVTLDLAGHSITGSGTNILIYGSGKIDLRVTNGALTSAKEGIHLESMTGGTARVDNVRISGVGASGWGILLAGSGSSPLPQVAVANNEITVASPTGTGIAVEICSGGRVAGNSVVGGGNASGAGRCIWIYQSSNILVTDNSATYGLVGIDVGTATGITVARNNLSTNYSEGLLIDFSGYCLAEDNLMIGNTLQGMVLLTSVGCVYRDNVARNSPSNYVFSGGSGNTDGGGNL